MKVFTKACLGIAVAAATAQLAYAQEQNSTEVAATTQIEEVRVTGSRIVRKDYTSSSPVATLDAEVIEGFVAVTVEEQLNAMPQFIAGNSSSTIAIGG